VFSEPVRRRVRASVNAPGWRGRRPAPSWTPGRSGQAAGPGGAPASGLPFADRRGLQRSTSRGPVVLKTLFRLREGNGLAKAPSAPRKPGDASSSPPVPTRPDAPRALLAPPRPRDPPAVRAGGESAWSFVLGGGTRPMFLAIRGEVETTRGQPSWADRPCTHPFTSPNRGLVLTALREGRPPARRWPTLYEHRLARQRDRRAGRSVYPPLDLQQRVFAAPAGQWTIGNASRGRKVRLLLDAGFPTTAPTPPRR